jgi:glycosyltransferase involved in cell wall biosynthesis
MTSIVIPAHNEAKVIGRLLDALLTGARPGEFDVVVVANGCSDRTADIARVHPGGVTVLELPQGSKYLALEAGDAAATGFPRLYVDADIELDLHSARRLVTALTEPGILAASPARALDVAHSSWLVRAYYRIWNQLPVVRRGLFGRGVLVVSEVGYQRIADRPAVMADDLYLHSQFTDEERVVVADATSIVHGPRTIGDLLRRRIRAAQGNSELGAASDGRTDSSVTSGRDLVSLLREHPAQAVDVAVFVAITVVARLQAKRLRRRGGAAPWLRDESSRG